MMHYQGGKKRLGGRIAEAILEYCPVDPSTVTYMEPFVGMASVMCALSDDILDRRGFDVNESVIMLLKAVRDGWDPPDRITEEEYYVHRNVLTEPSALRAFVGYGCSWGGKWFGGYARSKDNRNFAAQAKRSLMRMKPYLQGATFEVKDFRDHNPEGALIYCDPPYKGVTKHFGSRAFEYDEYLEVVTRWAETNHVVLSEYRILPGWVPIWSEEHAGNMRHKDRDHRNIEYLLVRDPLA